MNPTIIRYLKSSARVFVSAGLGVFALSLSNGISFDKAYLTALGIAIVSAGIKAVQEYLTISKD